MSEFLNPRSMVTPGAAGGIVMLVANTFWASFGIAPEWTAFAVSAVISVLIVTKYAAPLWERGCYFVLNALVIFCMASGAATVGAVAASSGGNDGRHGRLEAPAGLPQLAGLIGRAAAAEDDIDALCGEDGAELDARTQALCRIVREQAARPLPAAPAAEVPAREAPAADAPAEAAAEEQPAPPPPPPDSGTDKKKRSFFQPWFQQSK